MTSTVTQNSNEQHTQQCINEQSAELAKLEGELRASETQAKHLETQDVQVSSAQAKAMGESVEASSENSKTAPKADDTLSSGIIEKSVVEATGFGGVIEGAGLVKAVLEDKTHYAQGMGLDAASFANPKTGSSSIQTGFMKDIFASAQGAGDFMNPKDATVKVKGAQANSSSIDAMKNCKALKAGQFAQLKQDVGHSYAHKSALGHGANEVRMAAGAPNPAGAMGGGASPSATHPTHYGYQAATLDQNQRAPKPPTIDVTRDDVTEGA